MSETASKEKVPALESFVRSVVATVEDQARNQPRSKNSLPIALICAGLVAVIVAVLSFITVMARRRAALLEHELNVREEERRRAQMLFELKTNAVDRGKLALRALEIKKRLDYLRVQREALEARRIDYEAALSPITSWDELEIVRAEDSSATPK